MKTPDIFNLLDLELLLHEPLEIPQLLLVIADGLGRQLRIGTVTSQLVRTTKHFYELCFLNYKAMRGLRRLAEVLPGT